MQPLISVFIPTHARYRNGFLEKAIDSILAQTYSHFELFVVDDCSVDGTQEYLQKLAQRDTRVKHIRFDRNVGLPALTLFDAYRQSKGEFIAFNFDDTILTSNNLETLSDKLMKDPSLGMVYGQTVMHMPDGDITYGQEPNYNELAKFNFIGNASTMLRRSTIETIGWYDPHILLKKACDWDLWLRIFSAVKVAYVPEVLSEEFGQNLPDSFRRAYYSFDELMFRYMATGRNAALTPSAFSDDTQKITEVSFSISQEEKKHLRIACLEHFVSTMDFQRTADIASKLIAEGDTHMLQLSDRMKSATESISDTSRLMILGTTYYYSQKLEYTQNKLHKHEALLHEVSAELGTYKDQYHDLLRSLSWRVTKPLRETMALVSGRNKESQHV